MILKGVMAVLFALRNRALLHVDKAGLSGNNALRNVLNIYEYALRLGSFVVSYNMNMWGQPPGGQLMKKKLLALLLALITLASVFAGCKGGDDGVIDVLEPTPAPDDSTVLELQINIPTGVGMVAAGDVHTLGARSDGTVIVAGHDTTGQLAVKSWKNIVYVAAGETLSVGLTSGGIVMVAGNETLATEAKAWTDIAMVAAGAGHIVGLKTNGTVVAAGDNAAGQCNVNAWSDIVAVAAAGKHTIGLKKDGTLVATGDNAMGQCNISDWSGVKTINAGTDQTVAIKDDGTAISTKNDVSAWSDIVSIAAGGTATIGVTGAGSVVCIPDDPAAAAITDAKSVAAGAVHAVVAKKDGSVVAFGNDTDFQCGVDNWKISPYMDGTFILGFAPGMPVARVKTVVGAYTGSANIEIKAGGSAMADTDGVYTGVEVYKDGALLATLVVLGDVNADGVINSSDGEAVTAHLEGKSTLAGAALRAASIKVDSDGKLTKSCADAIASHSDNSVPLSQFPMTGAKKYDAELTAAKAKNSDVVGWIGIDGTVISYPIMFNDKELWYYNTHDLDKKTSESGSIYAFYNKLTKNNVITGHNSRVSGTMFHQLHHIQEFNLGNATCAYSKCKTPDLATAGLPDFKTYKGRIMTIDLYGTESQWEIFSMYETPASSKYSQLEYNTWYHPKDNWLDTDEQIQKWINSQIENSQYKFDVNVSPKDTFMTLYTCGNEHSDSSGGNYARLYFFLRKIN